MPHKHSKWSRWEVTHRLKELAHTLTRDRRAEAKECLRDVERPLDSVGEKVFRTTYPDFDIGAGDVAVDPKRYYIHPRLAKLWAIADKAQDRLFEELLIDEGLSC